MIDLSHVELCEILLAHRNSKRHRIAAQEPDISRGTWFHHNVDPRIASVATPALFEFFRIISWRLL